MGRGVKDTSAYDKIKSKAGPLKRIFNKKSAIVENMIVNQSKLR